MAKWLGLDTAGVDDGDLALATFEALDCEMLCVTRGGDGAVREFAERLLAARSA